MARDSSKDLRSRFHSTRHRPGAMPARCRSRLMSKTGWDGAPAVRLSEDEAATIQRLRAALGCGAPVGLKTRPVTPLLAAASIIRRLAVRSRRRPAPHNSRRTTPGAFDRKASRAARKAIVSFFAETRMIASGSNPYSVIPGPYGPPDSILARSFRIHTIGLAIRDARIARARAKPAPAPASPTSRTKTS